MAGTGKFKPGKRGKITSVLDAGNNIGIDGKMLNIIPERIAMAQKMDFKIGEEVEYKQLMQGADKGKVNFITRPEEPTPAGSPPPAAAPPADAPPRKEPENIIGQYISKTGQTITLKIGDESRVFAADLDVLKIVSAANPKVKPGDNVTVQLIDDGHGNMVAKKIGPGALGKQFDTAKDLLQQNIDSMKTKDAKQDGVIDAARQKAEGTGQPAPAGLTDLPEACTHCKMVHDCPWVGEGPHPNCIKDVEALLTKAKEDAKADALIKENEAEAKRLAETAHVNPGADVSISPVIIHDTLRQSPPQQETECPVEVKIHIDCGSYSNFDMTVPAMPIDQAIARIEADSAKFIALMHRIMAASKKGF